jgi:hypothetical protein
MNRDRYKFICLEAEAGRDAFVVHPASLEEGLVSSCVSPSEQLIVRTAAGKKRCWDFHECEELTRMKEEWPRR